MADKYILEGKKPVPCNDLLTWGKFLQSADRTVAKDTVGESGVSTVFLGLNHNFGDGPPLIFETMVFGGDHDGDCERYSTWEEAEAGHKEVVSKLRSVEKE